MGKQKSDIVRDKIIQAREAGKKVITLTDSEACDLWLTLIAVESDISALKRDVSRVLGVSFRNLEGQLTASKTRVKQVRDKN